MQRASLLARVGAKGWSPWRTERLTAAQSCSQRSGRVGMAAEEVRRAVECNVEYVWELLLLPMTVSTTFDASPTRSHPLTSSRQRNPENATRPAPDSARPTSVMHADSTLERCIRCVKLLLSWDLTASLCTAHTVLLTWLIVGFACRLAPATFSSSSSPCRPPYRSRRPLCAPPSSANRDRRRQRSLLGSSVQQSQAR